MKKTLTREEIAEVVNANSFFFYLNVHGKVYRAKLIGLKLEHPAVITQSQPAYSCEINWTQAGRLVLVVIT